MKQIKPTNIDINKAMKEFKKYLLNYKTNTGKINFNYDLNNEIKTTKKPKIVFSLLAYSKMQALIINNNMEIGWHGLVEVFDDVYYITDIVIYPQYVTSVTVKTDDTEYANWIMDFDDDTFNKIRLHGHSHVNMGVTPSNVDTTFYNQLLKTLNKDDFYIFMIMNKKGEINIWLYNYNDNLIYETNDLQIDVLDNNNLSLINWYKDNIKHNVKSENQTYFNKYDDFKGRDYYEFE